MSSPPWKTSSFLCFILLAIFIIFLFWKFIFFIRHKKFCHLTKTLQIKNYFSKNRQITFLTLSSYMMRRKITTLIKSWTEASCTKKSYKNVSLKSFLKKCKNLFEKKSSMCFLSVIFPFIFYCVKNERGRKNVSEKLNKKRKNLIKVFYELKIFQNLKFITLWHHKKFLEQLIQKADNNCCCAHKIEQLRAGTFYRLFRGASKSLLDIQIQSRHCSI